METKGLQNGERISYIEQTREECYYGKMAKCLGDLETVWAGQTQIFYEETDSTNLRAKALGADGVHGTLILADRQTAGRGRRGRTWESDEEENIYMSLYLRPEFLPEKAPMLTLVMAYSVAEALRKSFGIEAQIKWPNDLILNRKKICGILTEMTMEQWQMQSVIIGVGINVGNRAFPEELQERATSIYLETGEMISKAGLIRAIMKEFEIQYEAFCEAGDLSPMLDGYNQILVNRGREVQILDAKGSYNATAFGINPQGELQIEREDGTREHIFAGEVSVRGIYGYV